MDRRRNGLIALVVLVTAVAALVYYETRRPEEPTTAFAPAESADESVAPADTLIEPPADLAGVPGEDEIQQDASVGDAAPAVEGAEADVANAASPVEDLAVTEPVETTASSEQPAAADEGATVAEVPAAADDAVIPDTEVAMVDPATDVPPAPAGEGQDAPAPTAAVEPEPAPIAVPTFDIVRVEPSGDTVIAGQAEPNAVVEIMDGAAVIASAVANEGGEWVIALETPLEPGSHDLAISTTTADETIVTLSDERVTVSVPDDGSGDVLVVLNAPDAPSTILQVPQAAEPTVEEQVALAEEVEAVEEAVEQEIAAGTEAAVAEQAAEEELALADSETTPAEAVEDALAITDIAAEPPPEATVPATEAMAPPATADAAPAQEADAATAPESVIDEGSGEVATMDGGVAMPAADEPAADEPAADVAATGQTDEAQIALAPPSSEVADETPADVSEPEIAGESPIELEPPIAAEPPVTAEAEVAATAPVVEEPPAPPPPPQPMVTVAAVEADTSGALYVAGVAATGETVRVYIDDQYIDDADPSPSGTWLVETVMDLPAGQYLVRVDQVAADGSVIARYEVPFDREVEVAILKPTGTMTSADGPTLAGAMPEVDTVIIKRGDNLWRIARATWGKGIRWSTIYQANTDQIRNPHRIYPGQVFVMPKGDAAWQN